MSDERWYDVKEIVAMLGVHEQTVRRWIKQGDLDAILFGRKGGYRVKKSDLDRFLEAQRGKADLWAS
jgi:excisionase family DNA binding protein